MVVVAAARVERSVAVWAAGVAIEVSGDREYGTAGAAEDGWFEPFGYGPGLERMVGKGVVAVFAGVIEAAAFHFDGDDVERRVVMEAAGLWIEIQAVDFWNGRRHVAFRRKRIAERGWDGERGHSRGDENRRKSRQGWRRYKVGGGCAINIGP
ncbi:MAG: hypothetical protein WCE61_13815 [Candidatus Acidiferrum sp.]